MTRTLQELHGFHNVKNFKDEISWIEHRNPWLGFRWAYLSEVSGYSPEFIRFRNDMKQQTPKSFWPFDRPEIPIFEITVHNSEITPEFIKEFSQFVSFLSEDRDEIYTWDVFEEGSYPNYAWSLKALEMNKNQEGRGSSGHH